MERSARKNLVQGEAAWSGGTVDENKLPNFARCQYQPREGHPLRVAFCILVDRNCNNPAVGLKNSGGGEMEGVMPGIRWRLGWDTILLLLQG